MVRAKPRRWPRRISSASRRFLSSARFSRLSAISSGMDSHSSPITSSILPMSSSLRVRWLSQSAFLISPIFAISSKSPERAASAMSDVARVVSTATPVSNSSRAGRVFLSSSFRTMRSIVLFSPAFRLCFSSTDSITLSTSLPAMASTSLPIASLHSRVLLRTASAILPGVREYLSASPVLPNARFTDSVRESPWF